MKRTRTIGAVVAAVLAVLALAACGSSGGGSNATGTGASASTSPRHGGEMVMAFQSDPDTFDPQVCYDATCWDNMEMLFNRLYDYQGATTNLFAQAAKSMPTLSDGGRVYTIQVRPGMTFANGKAVTAADFVYSFSRICDHR